MRQMISKIKNKVPAHVGSLLGAFAFALLLLTLTRILFFVVHSEVFSNVRFTDWLAGVWFDSATLSLVLLPYIIVTLLPVHYHHFRLIKTVKVILYVVPVLFIVAFNLLDIGYFAFTHKRSTADLFAIVSAGNDVGQLLGSFIRDFWWLILIFIGLAILLIRYLRKRLKTENTDRISFTRKAIWFVALLPVFIIIGRGGLVLKPINIIDATLYTEPQNTALVLNSGFTILKSYSGDDLKEVKFYSEKECRKIFNPLRVSKPQHLLPGKPNVVIIMLESFGNEWVGSFNGGNSYTPFLDSLLKESWYFEYGFSNGKKSIEAVPTIVASVPALMDNPLISSSFSNNKIEGLPAVLKKAGYSTAFYHGATNGSMRFNSFTKQVGFDKYIGRFEYNNDAHFDKTWGILDEYFNPWSARQMSKQKQPFMATLFTLSSHHPYYIPPKWRNKLRNGPDPICKSLHYGDVSLKMFFEQAKREPWYENTVFVLVADHTPATKSEVYSQSTEMYRIPIAFYSPSGKLPKRRENAVFQQMDIMPTVIDLANVDTKYFSFGSSYFSNDPREAIAYLEGTYYYTSGKHMLVYSNGKAISLLDITKRTAKPRDDFKRNKEEVERMTRRLRAIIQSYSHTLMFNEMVAK